MSMRSGTAKAEDGHRPDGSAEQPGEHEVAGAAASRASGTPAPGAPVEVSRQRRNAVFGAVALGMLLAALDQTIVSTALPTIVGDLGGAGHLSWVVTGYLLAETVATALIGKFGDLFGRKQMFLTSVVVFLIGSFFSGFANSMTWLILWRAVQGLGAGGLMVTSSALVADVIPLRERGKYQGALGSVFGVVTVIGPLLGGLFVDHLSWRWAFYVNIPVGIIVLAVAVPAIPSVRSALKPIVDYLGIVLVSIGAAGLTLVTSWGGTTYAWGSPIIIGMAIGSVLALVVFVLVELRAREPVLPMRLFRNPVFAVGGPLGFIVGFAMLGGITFLPTFLQYVQGTSATLSGIRMLPMVVGILISMISSGNAVSATGRYKVFPIVGSVGMIGGLYLLSLMTEQTSFWLASVYMFVLGIGVGLCMQIPLIAVQNTVDYADLGVATSGMTFLRTIGSSFGVAVFGSVYSAQLTKNLTTAAVTHPLPAGVDPRVVQSPEGLKALPSGVAAPFVHAYAESLHVVFLTGAPIAVLALVLALFLKEVPLRGTARASAADVSEGIGDGFAMPVPSDRDKELERAIARLLRKEWPRMSAVALSRADSELTEAQAWCLVETFICQRQHGRATVEWIADRVRVPAAVLEPAFHATAEAGYLIDVQGQLYLTDVGEQEFGKLAAAWQEWVAEQLADWNPERESELPGALARLGRRLFEEQRAEPTAAIAAAAG
jgi:EmrB/QacA subfamily drug resistance transporter